MFNIYCDNKGCGKDQQPLLDVDTDEVICRECGKAIKSVTKFAKTQMKSLGQIKREIQKQEAFVVKCQKCQKHGKPKIDKSDKIICSSCSEEMTQIPQSF